MRSLKQILIYILIVIILFFILYKFPIVNKPQLIGGDKDKGGCLIGAGYSWCEQKQKCLRNWEEPCQAIKAEEFNNIGNLQKEGSDWFLVYEKPGQPALRARLTIDSEIEKTLETGDRVNVYGNIVTSPESRWIEVDVTNIIKN